MFKQKYYLTPYTADHKVERIGPSFFFPLYQKIFNNSEYLIIYLGPLSVFFCSSVYCKSRCLCKKQNLVHFINKLFIDHEIAAVVYIMYCSMEVDQTCL